jgi:hypothetical protein
MRKMKTKNAAIAVFLGVFLVGAAGTATAQQMLPRGGDGFETAVELKPGSYQGGSLESKEVEYFYVVIKAGEEVQIKGTFAAANVEVGAEAVLALYGEDGAKLAEEIEGFYKKPASIEVSWLADGIKDSYTCYIKAGSGIFEIDPYSLDVSVERSQIQGKETKEAVSDTGTVSETSSNVVFIIGIIAGIVILAIVAFLLLKKKKG